MRYTRQELKQDKLQETAKGAVNWTAAHRSTLQIVLIVVVIAAVVIGAASWYREHRNATASRELGNALVIYNAPVGEASQGNQTVTFATPSARSMAAKKEFYRISSEYSWTRSGQLAHYFAALCESDLASYKVAEEQLKDVSKSRDPEVSSLAKLALASVYRSENKEGEAISVYKELIAQPTLSVPKATAQLALAGLYEAKQPAEARKLYQEIAKDDPKGPAAQIAAAHEKSVAQ